MSAGAFRAGAGAGLSTASPGGRLDKRRQGERVGGGGRAFVPRVSRETCVARQHRRHIRALSYYACSSCIARQASPSGAGLSCCAGSERVRWRPTPRFPSPAPFTEPLSERQQGEGVGEGVRDSTEPAVDLVLHPNPRLCAESVTRNLRSTTTPAPDPRPVVLRMLFMHSSTGLAIPAEIVVLCRFETGAMAPASSLPQRRLRPRPDRHRHAHRANRPTSDDAVVTPITTATPTTVKSSNRWACVPISSPRSASTS